MRSTERITEQDLEELHDEGYFPYSSLAVRAGVFIVVAAVFYLFFKKAITKGSLFRELVANGTFGEWATLMQHSLIILFGGVFVAILVIGFFQTKFFFKFTRQGDRYAPKILHSLFSIIFAALCGFFGLLTFLKRFPDMLLQINPSRGHGAALFEEIENLSSVGMVICAAVMILSIIFSRIHFMMYAKRYLMTIRSRSGV